MTNETNSLVRRVEQVEVKRKITIPEGIRKYVGRCYRENNGGTISLEYVDYKA